ncbi:MAG: hybrid sensor histidine kinase/response regulator [Desulfobacteraceae bacterium]|nr:MAG: hybrid sensor histidine kinase/response regulator [Desulfobacteraceae bacterium]
MRRAVDERRESCTKTASHLIHSNDEDKVQTYRVLLTGDDPVLIRTMEFVLRSIGYQATIEKEMGAAIQRLNNEQYDIVIAEGEIAAGECLEVITAAKRRSKEVIAIVLAGDRDAAMAVKAFRAGADDYLLKPFSIEELEDAMSDCLLQLEMRRVDKRAKRRSAALRDHILSMLMSMAHEMKDPLQRLAAELTAVCAEQYGELEKQTADKLATVRMQSLELLHVAEEYLRNAAVIDGALELEREPLDLTRDVINPVLSDLAVEMRKKRITIENRAADRSEGENRSVSGSRVWLKTVFRSLFDKVIKDGGEGCVVGFDIERQNEKYRLNVFNTGRLVTALDGRLPLPPGMPDQATGMPAPSRSFDLTRQIILKHGGNIWYETNGCGSRFVFTLPRA